MKNPSPRTILVSVLAASLAFASFALSPPARAVCQEGCDLINFNTFLGDDALLNNINGGENTAIGFNALLHNQDGFYNTALGYRALLSNTSGFQNTALGDDALFSNTTGGYNTAVGDDALAFNTSGLYNTALGVFALANNTAGGNNTAIGSAALVGNTTGFNNTAIGDDALGSNTSGLYNTAIGFSALIDNSIGNSNTATGVYALQNNDSGNNNTACGYQALLNNTTGSFNVAIGNGAGANLTTGINNIDIGNNGVAGDSKTIRIGKPGTQKNAYIAGISGVTVPTGIPVIIDAVGHLGTTTSSARYKDDIKPMDAASEAIFSLEPVTFHYKKEIDANRIAQFGLVAEQVEKVDSQLVAKDETGKPYSVRYDAVNAMLLNEFLKEHRRVEEQAATIADVKATVAKQDQTIVQQREEFRTTIEQQQKEITALTAALKAQAAQIQKVSNQGATQAPAPRVVAND